MASCDNFCLCLSKKEEKVTKSWQELQSGQNFCDVTLSCDDNQILSHKVIIASINLLEEISMTNNIFNKCNQQFTNAVH